MCTTRGIGNGGVVLYDEVKMDNYCTSYRVDVSRYRVALSELRTLDFIVSGASVLYCAFEGS